MPSSCFSLYRVYNPEYISHHAKICLRIPTILSKCSIKFTIHIWNRDSGYRWDPGIPGRLQFKILSKPRTRKKSSPCPICAGYASLQVLSLRYRRCHRYHLGAQSLCVYSQPPRGTVLAEELRGRQRRRHQWLSMGYDFYEAGSYKSHPNPGSMNLPWFVLSLPHEWARGIANAISYEQNSIDRYTFRMPSSHTWEPGKG